MDKVTAGLLEQIETLVGVLADKAEQAQVRLATAESCTGGSIAAALTQRAGSSAWFECGFVTYANEAKQSMLGVRAQTLAEHGAVSEQTAQEMALGALQHSRADWAVSVTGIAGPTGAVPGKPVGTVVFGFAHRCGQSLKCTSRVQHFAGDRQAVRIQSVRYALEQLCLCI